MHTVIANALKVAFWGFVAVVALYVASHFAHRDWDTDEFEHLQFSWMLSQGKIPYKDFFEHHTPLYNYLGSLIFLVFPLQNGSNIGWILGSFRTLSLVLGLGTVIVSWNLAKFIRNDAHGITPYISTVLLISSLSFIYKYVEIRPDTLSSFTTVVAFYFLARAFDFNHSLPRRVFWSALAGLSMSIAIFSSQKALFVVPGFIVSFAGLAIGRVSVGDGAKLAGAASAAGAIPVFMLVVYFHQHDALANFIYDNFLLNANWPRRGLYWQITWARIMIQSETLLIISSLVGCLIFMRSIIHGTTRLSFFAVVSPLISLGVGYIVIPIVQRQYFLMALPFMAIAGGSALERLISYTVRRSILPALAIGLLAIYDAGISLHAAFQPFPPSYSEAGKDAVVRAKLAYVVDNTPTTATVMNGWSCGIAFRLPAFRYEFLNPEIQEIILPSEYKYLIDGLQTGGIAPEVVDIDRFMLQMPEPIPSYLLAHYKMVGLGTLAIRSTSEVEPPGNTEASKDGPGGRN
jgi:hypothetical protein